jgi:hypothetical protein
LTRATGCRTRETRTSSWSWAAPWFGDVAYAVQFHVEVTDPMFEQWGQVPAYAASARAALGPSGFEDLARAFAESRETMAASADRMFHTWLDRAAFTVVKRS